MKNSLYYFFGVFFMITSCIYKGNAKNERLTYESIKIVIVSPYGCLEELSLYSNGYGNLKSGRKNADIDAENIDFDSVFSIKDFKIQESKKVDKLNKIFQSLKKKEGIRSSMKYDTYRFRVFIDGVNKLDIFGETLELNKILKLIINDLPISENKCDYFQNFKARGSR